MILAGLTAADAQTAAAVHAEAFARPWSAGEIAALLAGTGVYGFLARGDEGAPALGFILARALAGEAEILTVAVRPALRRRGVARALLEAAVGAARAAGAQTLFLEVACDNTPAIGLYQAAGFGQAGRRPGYYHRAGQPATDALIFSLSLNTATG